ncbi:MEKHLA domain-containing protein [Parasphingorhabdus flavimaris]|uniref:histidine kinase n=1 Tax=Parasphingorhabdus flavimaris TaxID=266812 RepID=A0ABX2N2Y2_9SPHN|nr:PAS domain S-box protein [Parasphingorhabdus flavimaris]NVD28029.1 MEKHLA domain-containing protein [Parasphingorhabdus flavimaris]|tara:strand:+ start:5628 stop:7907 length:2280 start_codon:yes stop_codon:yes gene_type:complete
MVQTTRSPDGEIQSFASVQAKLASCSKVVGEAFFPVMVEALAEALSVRSVFLSTLHPTDPSKACTVAVWDNGPGENFEYQLEHTPCANIVEQGACCFPDNIVDLFPQDHMLNEMGAKSYIGTPLRTSSGEILGLLAVLDDKTIAYPEQATEIVELFSGRAAAELERLATSSLNERLGRIVEDSVSEVYVFGADSYYFELVNRGARENLGYSMEELRHLTPWDLKPHYSKDEFIEFVTPLRNGDVPSLLFEAVHERKDGSHYDVAVQLQFFPGVENLFYASITDITDARRAERAQAHLAAIVASSNEAIISKTLNSIITSWNDGAEKIFGYPAEEMIGKSIRLLIPPERQEEEDDILARMNRGEKISNYETVRVARDGRRVDVAVNVSPIYDAAGNVVGASKIAHDISERKRAEERERLLMGEVNHRAKNMLTLVQVIARQTAANDAMTFVQRFEERILALSASHDVLLNSGWQDIPLQELVQSQLAHFRDTLGSRIKLMGPPLKITAPAAQAIGMAVHELATNAAKYGALSNDDGIIEIDWKIEQSGEAEPDFSMHWTERGGPVVEKPTRNGFGSTVIDRLLAASLEGEVDLEWEPAGLVCRISCRAAKLLSGSAAAGRDSNAVIQLRKPRTETTRRILVVEDEILIGLEISEVLKDAGFDILGPVTTVGGALEQLENELCDAAVLDINLGKETSEPVAKLLSQMGTPYLSVSGRSAEDRPAAFSGSQHLAKPIQSALLVKEVGEMLAATAPPSAGQAH